MKKFWFLTCTAIILALSTLAVLSYGAEGKSAAALPGNTFKTKTKTVAIFKDGYGFFLREGRAHLIDGWCMTDYIPRATAGTFWFYTLENGTAVNTIRSTSKNMIKFESPNELVQTLGDYTGVQISLTTPEVVTEGELLGVMNDLILVKSGKDVKVVQIKDVKTARILGQPLLIQVDNSKPVNDVTVRMGYLQQGINWTPTYTLDLISPKEARITLKATITNTVEDLDDCNILFVVGVPNFALKNQLDPLTAHSLGAAVLSAMPPSVAGPSQAISNSRSADMLYKEDETAVTGTPISNIPVEGLQSLYFYDKQELDLAIGDVVMTTIMTGTVPYRVVFTWDVDSGKEVYQHVAIKNTLDAPLTTGPVMVVQNGKPVSQDYMKYISPKAEGRLKLTTTTDIRTAVKEMELERQPTQVISSREYIPVVSQGQLIVKNLRNETSEVEVTWSVQGKVTEVTDNAEVQSQPQSSDGLNPKSSMRCQINVPPGQKHTITYTYLRYLRP